MNTAFKFEVTNTFYKDVEDAINFLIKKKKISTYTNEQIEKIAYEIHNMNWSDLVNFSNKHYTNDWSDILWFSYASFIGLIQQVLDEIDEFDRLEAADKYLCDLNSDYENAFFEEVEKHSENYPRILKSDHPDAFKENIFVFSYWDSNENTVVEYVDLEDCTDDTDVSIEIDNAIDFDDLNKLEE